MQKHRILPNIDIAQETNFTILYAHIFQIENNDVNTETNNKIQDDINKLKNWSRPQPTAPDFEKAVDKAYIQALANDSTTSEDEEDIEIINEIRNRQNIINPETIQNNNNINNTNKIIENQLKTIEQQRKNHKVRDLMTEDIPAPPEVQRWENINNNDIKTKGKRALKWYEEYMKRKDLIIKIPRINKNERAKVREGLKDLFNREIIPL